MTGDHEAAAAVVRRFQKPDYNLAVTHEPQRRETRTGLERT
jgi:hypothetical protein